MPKKLKTRKPDSPLSIVGTKRWRETVPVHLRDSLAKALDAMEQNKLGEALMHFGECATLEESQGRMPHKAVLYFGAQVAAAAYFAKRGDTPNAPQLTEWHDVALALTEAAYEVAPDDAVACHNVGRFLQDDGDDQRAIQYYKHALLLDSAQVETYGNLGTALYQQDRVSEAWPYWRKCVELPADKASARIAQSYVWLRLGDYANGWPAFNDRWKDLTFAQNYGRQQALGGIHWTGQPLPKTHKLFLHGEQGLGDHVQFARYIPVLLERGVNVVGLETRGVLKRWMQASFPDVPVFERDAEPLPMFTHHCSTMDLPGLLGTTLETVPPPVAPHG